MWVGFWYTAILNALSASRNGVDPFSWLPSTVNFIAGPILFIWSRNNCLWACWWITKVIHKPEPKLGGSEADLRASLQNAPCTDWQLYGRLVTPWLLPQPVYRIYFGKRSMYYADRTPKVQWCSVLIVQTCHTKYHPVPIDL